MGNKISEDVVAANTILIHLIFLSAFILDAYAFSTEGISSIIGSKNIKLQKEVIKNSNPQHIRKELQAQIDYAISIGFFVFGYGLRLDLSIAAYLVIIPFILVILLSI